MAYARLMRLDKPVGTWLLLWPCWWGAVLAAEGWPGLPLLLWFAVGALVMRSAGCVINDLADRDLDRHVERTRTRPLASGELSVGQALVLLALLLLTGLWVLLQFSAAAVWVGIGALPLVAAYPFMKRITYWPQLVLGLTFNWGMLVAFAEVRGAVPVEAAVAYAACVCWTLGYDTLYAVQDMRDDQAIGVKSTALRFGRRLKPWVGGFYAGFVGLFGYAAWLCGYGGCFFAALALAAAHLAWQTATLDMADAASAGRRFRSNIGLGWIIFLGLMLDRAL